MDLRAVAAGMLALFLLPVACRAADSAQRPPSETAEREPGRYGMTIGYGNSMDPDRDIRFLLVSAFGQFDYGKVWGKDRPKELRYKVEGAAGGTFHPDRRAIVSLGAAVLYHLPHLAGSSFRPYAEAGIGVVYTDFQVKEQGLRINFNPQITFGTEFGTRESGNFLIAFRMHHLSNGGLHRDNRGVNSLILQIGRYY